MYSGMMGGEKEGVTSCLGFVDKCIVIELTTAPSTLNSFRFTAKFGMFQLNVNFKFTDVIEIRIKKDNKSS